MLSGKENNLCRFHGVSYFLTRPIAFSAVLCLVTCGDGNLEPPPTFQYECSDITDFQDTPVICGKTELCVSGYGQETRGHLCVCDILCICWVGVGQDAAMLILGGEFCKLGRDSREDKLLEYKELLDEN